MDENTRLPFTHYDKETSVDGRWYILYDGFRHCHLTPKNPGIYCFIEWNIYTKKYKALYVGKSQDLSVRLKPWHPFENKYEDLKKEFGAVLIVKIMLTKDFHKKELEYIKRLKPPFNVHGNPNIKRRIIYEIS